MKKIKRATICFVMAVALLITAMEIGRIKVKAAEPFWGANYRNPGQRTVEVEVNVTSSVSGVTLKTWDFTGPVSLMADVYDSNDTFINRQYLIVGQNETKSISINTTKATGTYKVRCTFHSGEAGGWIGVWIF